MCARVYILCMLQRDWEGKRGARKLMSSDETSRNPQEREILSYEKSMRFFFFFPPLFILPSAEESAVHCGKNYTFMLGNETMFDSTSCIGSVVLELQPVASYLLL